MRRLLNVEQALHLLFERDGAEGNADLESEPESEDFDDEGDDPSFVLEEEREEKEPPTSAPSGTRRSTQRRGRCSSLTLSWSPLAQAQPEPRLNSEPWKMEEDADTAPAWMDTREVSVCSTIHPAFSGDTVRRNVKDRDGRWAVRDFPCPTPIVAYNQSMGVMSNAKQVQPMTHKDFIVELVSQHCGMDKEGVPQSRRADHVPVPIVKAADASQKATKGRLKCKHCLQVDNRRSDTPWKCQACDVPLCVVVDRNCFSEWHK
ncbi:hypothetical protein ABVT39_020736 [Epinephelus coioides]